MTRQPAQRPLSLSAMTGVAVLMIACGGTANNPREQPSTTAGMGGMGGFAGFAGSVATAGTTNQCQHVVDSALIVDFDEGATILDQNYPIPSESAMPGGTYVYADPTDTTVMLAVALVAEGHRCQALSLSITGSSWRGVGLWSTTSVDATAYSGVVFWARRGANATGPGEVTLSLGLDAVTMSGTGAGTCAGTTGCVRPQAKLALTDTWTEYALPWASFTPGSADGVAIPASGAGVNGLDLAFTVTPTGTPTVTAVWLDDMAFLR